ncbi:MAG: hypothetical protein M3335_01815 [Actinomycetota bacterium]|nr:hypothetical protein [Actinomycetota bacterium]
MRHLKKLALTVAAVAALSAVVSVGTASATALYSGGAMLGAGTKVEVTGTNGVFKAGFATFECSHSELEGKTSSTGGASETVQIPLSTSIFRECNSTWKTLKNGAWTLHWTSGSNATVTSEGWEFTVTLGGSTSCVYGTPTATDIGTLTGGNPATLNASASFTRIAGGFLCANPATWTMNFTFITPRPLEVAAS